MNAEMIEQPITIDIYGFSGIAVNKEYGSKAFQLSGWMWNAVKSNNLKNKGRNIWVYETGDRVFAGVGLEELPKAGTGLEHKVIKLDRYAYYKHVGPYSLVGQVGNSMNKELKQKGLIPALPYIEIYGHWVRDESKLETELITAIG